MVISREAIAPMVLPEELVEVAAIGGEVLVRGMDLPRLARLDAARQRAQEPLPGETLEATKRRADLEALPVLLHLCVLASDEQPVYSAAQWAVFLQKHQQAGIELANTALRLSGLDDPKNA